MLKLFAKFRESESDETVVILHSLGIAEHCNNIFGEIDFVIICKEGILCVEVKGGTVERSDAYWVFTNRYGKRETKLEGPFVQVQGNMQSLRTYLKSVWEIRARLSGVFASCVIMPDCDFYMGIDIIRDVLFDHSFQWTLSDIIRQVSLLA